MREQEPVTTWRVQARSSHLDLAETAQGLVVTGWGPDDVPSDGFDEPGVRPNPFVPDPDRAAWLLPTAGVVQLGDCDLVARTGGVHGTGLALLDVTGDEHRLTVRQIDPGSTLLVTTHLIADPRHDIISQWQELEALDEPVTLERVLSGSWYVPGDGPVTVDYLSGGWSAEYTPSQATLGPGRFAIGSTAGITSHAFTPWLSVSTQDVTRSLALGWCGSWTAGVDVGVERGWVRLFAGVADEIVLAPGESFSTPRSHALACHGDPAPHWREFGRSLGRGLSERHHPVVHNSWYATGFDVSVDQQVRLARTAAELGVEVFVVDDGWFAGRNSDRAGLGDWTPDPAAFPDGLGPLIDQVTALGMRFGLWVEPEGVNPDSDLFRAHPDWAYAVPGRERYSARHQYVLDFGRPAVVAWAKDWLRTLLRGNDITFLKWDMNRVITDTGACDPGWAHRHATGYLDVMQTLREEFPDVTIEACSGGGGRVDWSVLPWCDVLWASDETGPRDRLAIQEGFTRVFPASVMSSWVTDMPDQRDTRTASLEFRCLVAMCGVLGIGVDLSRADADALATMRDLVTRYRELRPTILGGELRWHGRPHDPACAVEYSDEERTVVFCFRDPDTDPDTETDTVAELTLETSRGTVQPGWELAADCDLLVLT